MDDLDHRMTWVHTVIKTAPMLGLFGTVLGMMGAFGKLAAAERVNPTDLASDISLALITTAIGLTTAIPLMVFVASINIRIRQMEELVAAGLNHFLEGFQAVLDMARQAKVGRRWPNRLVRRTCRMPWPTTDTAGLAIAPRRLEDTEMDITPMIDCTFLLLIFFLLTFKADEGATIPLPPAKYGIPVSAKTP